MIFQFLNDWVQFGMKYGWEHLSVIKIELERDIDFPAYILEFKILGIGFYIRKNLSWDNAPQAQEILKTLDKLAKQETDCKNNIKNS